jgi:membrane protein implicated in regulation of membrane protease activity
MAARRGGSIAPMGLVYLASLVFGLGVLLLQVVFGGKDIGHHGDLGHSGHDGKDLSAHDAGILALVTSTRFWIFAALGFGLSGSIIHVFALAGVIATAVIAGGAGLVSGLFATLAFRAVRRGSISTTSAASDAVGQLGKVLVAVTPGRVGQVRLELRGQSVDFLATTDDDELARGERVLVEEVRGTVLHVTRRPPELE